jgi:hypothetical protein
MAIEHGNFEITIDMFSRELLVEAAVLQLKERCTKSKEQEFFYDTLSLYASLVAPAILYIAGYEPVNLKSPRETYLHLEREEANHIMRESNLLAFRLNEKATEHTRRMNRLAMNQGSASLRIPLDSQMLKRNANLVQDISSNIVMGSICLTL